MLPSLVDGVWTRCHTLLADLLLSTMLHPQRQESEAFQGRNREKAEPGKRLQILQTKARNDISQCKQSLIAPPPPRWGFPS